MRVADFRRSLYSLAIGCFIALAASPAEAHPHVWVDTVVTALFDQGKVTALRQEWWFDEDFTVMALSEVRKTSGMAAAARRPLSPGEVDQLKAHAFSNLANYGYFTHVWAAGKPVGVAKQVSAFAARMDGDKLAYTFTLPLAAPTDPKALRIGVWDDTYYVDVGPAKGQSVRLEGAGSEACHVRIIDDKDHLIYYGQVTPKVMEVTC
jgi:ABC-type uncharacterized transport system substrate-binding protein